MTFEIGKNKGLETPGSIIYAIRQCKPVIYAIRQCNMHNQQAKEIEDIAV